MCCPYNRAYNSPLQIVIFVWHTFWEFELAGSGVGARNGCLAHFKFKKRVSNGHYYMQRAATPDSTSGRIVAEGRETLKAVQAL